jgi:hypothetical protein
MKNLKSALVAGIAAASAVAGSANAAAIDTTATVTAITDSVTAVGAIGVAVLGVYVAIKTYKWVRRAM